MGREIKFRVWDNRLKKFVQDFWLDSDGSLYYPNTDLPYKTGEKLDNRNVRDLAPLMQYTGLKDKNGVEIYEGDICEWIDSDKDIRKSEVFFARGGFKINNFNFNSYDCLMYQSPNGIKNNLTIIGNIYENPELLN